MVVNNDCQLERIQNHLENPTHWRRQFIGNQKAWTGNSIEVFLAQNQPPRGAFLYDQPERYEDVSAVQLWSKDANYT